MARPKKQTVDYFPHQCSHGKTMYILEQKYGNNGYAFWFKLLEMLGTAEGHYIDFNDKASWEFLQAKTHLDDSFCTEMLDLLANLQAIDNELWQNKIVFCQHFVDGISSVYTNRRVDIPQRPDFYIQKPQSAVVSTDQNTQSKVNKSKVNKTKLNNSDSDESLITSELEKITNLELKKALQDFLENRQRMKKPLSKKAYDLLIGKLAPYSDEIKIESLNNAIINGWQSVYPKVDGKTNIKVKENPAWMSQQTTEQATPEELEELQRTLKSFKEGTR